MKHCFELILWSVFCAAIPILFVYAKVEFTAPAVIGISSFFALGIAVKLYFERDK